MDKILGISIEFFLNGDKRDIAKDGFVGEFNKDDRALISTVIPSNIENMYVLTVDGKWNILERKDKAEYTKSLNRNYRLKITILQSDDPRGFPLPPRTVSPSNTMQFLQLDPNGNFQLWKTSLISQKGKFFLVTAKSFKGCCYQDGDKIACPQFEKRLGAHKDWKQMVTFLAERLDVENLSPIEEYEPEPEITISESNIGTLRHWDFSTGGTGVLLTKDGKVAVHWSKVPKRKGSSLRFLSPREKVRFKKLVPHFTAFGKPSSGLKMKAEGIELIK